MKGEYAVRENFFHFTYHALFAQGKNSDGKQQQLLDNGENDILNLKS